MTLLRADLQALSRIRRREARSLLDVGLPAGAYYLTGYSIECALKACVARRTPKFSFPEKERALESYTHDLTKLLRVAGLDKAFDAAAHASPALARNWAIAKDWKETSRYDHTIDMKQARALYKAATGQNGVLPWLRQNW